MTFEKIHWQVPPGTPAKEDLPLLRLIEQDSHSIISEEASEYDLASNADSSLDYLSIERDLRRDVTNPGGDGRSENEDARSDYAPSLDDRASVMSCESGEVGFHICICTEA